MTGRHWIAAIALTLIAGLAIACGGGGNGSATATPVDGAAPVDGATPAGDETSVPASTEQPAATPSEFEGLRDDLIDQLDAIGVNIGVLPDDVREDLLARCVELAPFANADRVDEICGAVEQAMGSGDVGLIDLVLDDLAELEAG